MRDRERHELLRLPAPLRIREDARVLDVVEQPGRVREELADGDRAATRDEPRQPALDGIVETKPTVFDEQEHEGGHERLRDAADPEAIARAHPDRRFTVREAACFASDPPAVAHDDEHAGRPGRDDAIEERSELGRGRAGRAATTREDGNQSRGEQASHRRTDCTLGAVRYRFVDCRWELGSPARGRELYLAGHVPGAAFLDVDADLSDPPGARGRHPLPDPERFAGAASRAGIGPDVFVVAYGTMGGAERLWWLLRHFGHDDCAVFDFETWRGPLRGGAEEMEPAEFVPRPRADDVIEAEELAARLDQLVVVDARLAPRWRGEPNPIDRVPGRIPGARNAPWNEPLPELPDGEVVAYCGSGVTASVVVHRLALAGREARLYPGSWSEWEQRDLPVERDG